MRMTLLSPGKPRFPISTLLLASWLTSIEEIALALRFRCVSITLLGPPVVRTIMKSILSGVLVCERLQSAESSARALPIEFIELSERDGYAPAEMDSSD